MMEKKVMIVLLLPFLCALAVTALEVKKTEFVVSTDPYQNLSITVINSDTREELEIFGGRARKFGEYRFTYYGVVDQISLSASIVDNSTGDVIKTKEFGPYTLGLATVRLNFSLIDESTSEETQEVSTALENSTLAEENGSGNTNISGFAVGPGITFSKNYYFIAAGAVAVILLVFLLRKRVGVKPSAPVEPNPKKIVKEKKVHAKKEVVVKPATAPASTQSVDETEKKITDLQKQLDQVRNEEKLLKLQRQLDQEREELRKLQQEGRGSQNPSTQN